MMKFKKVSGVLALTMGLALLSGCGKSQKAQQKDMIKKYSEYCTLGDYKGVEYVETKTEITDDMVTNKVNSLISQYTTEEEVKEGTTKSGDKVNIDFVGKVNGTEFEGGNSNGAGYDLVLGSGSMIPGFEDQIIGHKVGETFDIKVSFPDDYPANQDLAGKPAVFTTTINSLKIEHVPDYTDEFVASNTDAASIEEYEKQVKDELTETYKESDDTANKSAIMEKIIDNTTFKEYPEKEMKSIIDKTIEDTTNQAQQYGYDLQTFVTTYYGFSTEDAFREYVSEIAENYMKEKIVVCAIAKAEDIKTTDDDIKAFKEKMMKNYNLTKESELDEMYTEEDYIYYALAEKVSAFLIENGTPTEATETDAEPAIDESTADDATAEDASATDAN